MKLTKTLKLMFRSILMNAGTMATDKATLIFDGDTIAEGIDVFIEKTDDEGNVEYVVPEDGEYLAEDGKKLTIEGGKIVKIEEPVEPEVVPETTEEPAEEPVVAEEEVTDEPAAEPAEEETTDEPSETDVRFAELTQKLEELMNANVALEARIATLEEKVAAVEATPAAEPVAEEHVEHAEVKTSKLALLRK